MAKTLRWRIIITGGVLLACCYYVYPTVRWASVVPGERRSLESEWRERDAEMVDETFLSRAAYSLEKWIHGDPERVLNLGLDLKGGMHVVLQVETENLSEEAKKDAVPRAVEIIRNRVDEFGVTEPTIFPAGGERVVVQLPGVEEPQRALDLIGKTALLEFKLVADNSLASKVLFRINSKQPLLAHLDERTGYTQEGVPYSLWFIPQEKLLLVEAIISSTEAKEALPVGYHFRMGRLLPDREAKGKVKELFLLRKEPVVKGMSLRNAQIGRGGMFQSVVNLDFDREGMRKLRIVSSEAEKKYKNPKNPVVSRLAIVLDDVVYSAPLMKVRLDSSPLIEGRFTVEEANDLAIVLRAGALPAPVKIIENRTVGPSLGRDSILRGIRAMLVGLVLVVFFMLIYYLRCGIIADLALFFNLLIVIAALSLFRATLTLPGIAGIILIIGMSVDANVLIFERIREELALGRKIRAAVNNGYSKAFITIIDSNLTTLITAVILFWLGTGPVRGFAVTLSIGIIASMFTALFVTRTIFMCMGRRSSFRRLKMLQAVGKTSVDFLGKKAFAFVLSGLIIAVGWGSFFQKGWKNNFGIDFSGGALHQFEFAHPVSLKEVRTALNSLALDEAVVQRVENEREVIVKTPVDRGGDIVALFKEQFPDNPATLLRNEMVGPTVGKVLRQQAFLAILIAFCAIVIYISWRFRKFQFGIAALLALIHDVIVSVGFLALTGREINLPIVAALLTIVGYSLNDTIVVFDRIREDLRLMRRAGFKDIINTSINQTLARTLLTSLTTFIVVLSLYLFGGMVINDFAFTLMVGVIVGTYSSIFIASPVLASWPGNKK